MSNTVNDYRSEYNKLLAKEKSQETFVDSELFSGMKVEARDMLFAQYQDTQFRLNDLLGKIKYYTSKEILEGFELVDYDKTVKEGKEW